DGDLVARLTGDIDALDTVFLLSLLPLLVGGICGVAVVALLAAYVPRAAVPVAVLWLAGLWLLPAWLARRVRASGGRRQQLSAALRQQVLQAVDGHAEVLALGAMERAKEAFRRDCEGLRQAALHEARAFAAGQALALLAGGLAVLAAAAAGAYALREGQAGGAVLAGCVLAVAGLFDMLSPLARGAARTGAAAAASRRLRAIEDARPSIVDPPTPKALAPRATLELRDVRYRHHPQQPLLEGVSLAIAPGQRVVLQGASGSGKSTLLSLLVRLRDPDSGSLRWGGVELREAQLAELRRRIVWLPQDPPVFLGTVRDNLRIGDPDADDAGLWEALRQAGLDEEIRALPGGLDQWLGEGGRTLSAGQARRLCLARVLLTGAPLVALDEPTEGLDPDAEQAFFRDLPRILHGRSLLLVTHALVPSGIADATWELVDGRLRKKPVHDAP